MKDSPVSLSQTALGVGGEIDGREHGLGLCVRVTNPSPAALPADQGRLSRARELRLGTFYFKLFFKN